MELNFNELYSATTADLKAQDAELVKRSNKSKEKLIELSEIYMPSIRNKFQTHELS